MSNLFIEINIINALIVFFIKAAPFSINFSYDISVHSLFITIINNYLGIQSLLCIFDRFGSDPHNPCNNPHQSSSGIH